jgi:CRISPR-associated protein Cas1
MMHKDRIPFINLQYGTLSVKEGTLLFFDKEHGEQGLPVGQFSMINLEPGTSVTHAAVELCAKHGTLLNWIGESGVRMYASGLAFNNRTDRLWKQMEMAFNKNKRLSVAKRMYQYRFGTSAKLTSVNVENLMLMEGQNVKKIYKSLAENYNVEWNGRWFDNRDKINLALSVANSCIYGIAHTAILACGYSPALGFIHGRTSQSFVYDVADLVKFQTVTPIAFQVVSENAVNTDREVRYRCRDLFKEKKFIHNLIPVMDKCIGFIEDEEIEANRVLPRFEFWDYANRITNESEC